ncbi:hypothetical protein AQ490_07825 [Wenjunlia vitaminophila]|uniref:Uncharacterized protein n=1 Tax=Wenjunlia vitaminophila TaxID=76728 RepID=A0A0T6LNA4_WENVI|nr:DUF5819 family protein [Wenjunlia vitaminophila]KRV47361.1 hypothetical protein AQ490_07825 [Wenjunlia vitaminophila]
MTEPTLDGERRAEEVLPDPPGGGEWSIPARIAIAGAVAAVCVAVVVHALAVFLYLAPSNTVSRQNNDEINEYVLPEFEQNWKLFAPNPVQQNVAVHARAEVRRNDGKLTVTGWVDLTALDTSQIKHHPAPSHADQNLLRRAFDFYGNSHDQNGAPRGERGEISEEYLRRIAAHRLGPELNGGRVNRIQLRSVSTPVAAPDWSNENLNTNPTTRELPWWTVFDEDFS